MNTIIETPSKHAIDYNITDAALMELRERYKAVPNLETKDGYKEASSALSVLRKYRTDVEKKRKELKADALEYGRMVDAEAKRITASLEAIENPIKQAKDEYDTRKQREEEARIKAIRERIGWFSSTVFEMNGKPLATMREALEILQRQEIDESYGEFRDEAERTKRDSLDAIMKLIAREEERVKQEEALRIERERLAQERAEMEARRKEEAEQRRAERETIEREKRELEALRREEEQRVAQERAELDAKQRELNRLRREEEQRTAKEREEIKQTDEKQTPLVDALKLRTVFEPKPGHGPNPAEPTSRWVLTLKVVGGEFALDTHLGLVTTTDKEELMQLIAGTLHEVTL